MVNILKQIIDETWVPMAHGRECKMCGQLRVPMAEPLQHKDTCLIPKIKPFINAVLELEGKYAVEREKVARLEAELGLKTAECYYLTDKRIPTRLKEISTELWSALSDWTKHITSRIWNAVSV